VREEGKEEGGGRKETGIKGEIGEVSVTGLRSNYMSKKRRPLSLSPSSPTSAIGAVRQNMLRKREVCLAYVRGTAGWDRMG
jgi:hypothetical protein